MRKKYRNGPVGALMDEYERAAAELAATVQNLSPADFTVIIDPTTADPDCRSIQTVMNHVIRAGYGYANYIRKQFGNEWRAAKQDYALDSPQKACEELADMLRYTIATLHDKWELSGEEVINNLMVTSWGQTYDFEQIMEHAIVHVLRHRRQIERFLLQLQ